MRSTALSPLEKSFLRRCRATFAAVEAENEILSLAARRAVVQEQFNVLLHGRFTGAMEAQTPAPFAALLDRFSFTLDEDANNPNVISPEMLGTVFETFLYGRHGSGAYYTPKTIASFMCREALKGYLEAYESGAAVRLLVDEGYASALMDTACVVQVLTEVKVCDPACGSGAFLVGMLYELERLFQILEPVSGGEARAKRRARIISHNLYGVDLAPLALKIVSQRLELTMRHAWPEAPSPECNLRCEDSLSDSRGQNGVFDVVVTNPPYLSTKHGFGKNTKAELARRYRTAIGQFDAYGLFIEHAFDLLRDGGHYAYIVPRPVLTNRNMRPVRELMAEHHLRGIALPEGVFGAGVETVVIVGSNALPKSDPVWILHADGGRREVPRPEFVTANGIWNVAPGREQRLPSPESLPKLSEFVEIYRGIECGKRDGAIATAAAPGLHPLLRGEDIVPFRIEFDELYIQRSLDNLKFKPLEMYAGPKLLLRRVSNFLVAAVDETDAHVLNTVYILKPRPDSPISLWYLCGLLNSQVLHQYFQQLWVNDDRLFPYIRKEQLLQLPIRLPDEEAIAIVAGLARQLAAGEEAGLKAQLEEEVAGIYGVDADV